MLCEIANNLNAVFDRHPVSNMTRTRSSIGAHTRTQMTP
jgi:hypothetical protein